MVQMGLIWLILNKITHITSLNQAKRDAAVKSSLWNKDTDQYILLQCSVQFSHSVVSDSFQPHGLQHARPPCPSPSSCPLSSWCHPTISSSVVPFSSCFQSFPASGSFLKFFFLKNFYFYFILLYNTVLVLPHIDMNPPRVYMRSQIWTPPPTSLPTTSLWVIPVHQPQACCILHRT